ncbi:MAG: hypothetical protein COB53_00870 [Elusimicrobia bacterium]|nr:MAG: hypothetical protein COB53_00870 [Elusimicrobiota bacterium]
MNVRAANGVELFYDFLEHPERAARAASERPPVAFGVAAYIAAAATFFLAQSLSGVNAFGSSWIALLMYCVWNVASGFLMAALVHLFADGMGGEGRVTPLFVMLGYSELAWSLALPVTLITLAVFPDSMWPSIIAMGSIGFIVFLVKVRTIRLNYRFSRLQAAVSLAAPYGTIAAALVLGLGGMFWMVIAAVSRAAA